MNTVPKLSCLVIVLAVTGCGGEASVDAGDAVDAAPAPDGGLVLDGGGPPVDAGGAGVSRCYDGLVEVTMDGALAVARTEHYEVVAQADVERAERFARMLEAAFEPHAAFFAGRAERGGERLRVRFFADTAAFHLGLAEDGLSALGGAGGYFHPSTETAYVTDQPTRYYTRVLLLHEAAHQYQYLVSGGEDPPFWYGEGVAEYISLHHWDGRCIELGVLPLLTQEDRPAEALSMLEGGALPLAGVVDESLTASRALAWAVVRYFLHVDGGALAADFRRFMAVVAGGTDVRAAFRSELGEPSSHDAPLLAFLRAEQEPMTPTFLEWTHVGPEAIDGESDVFTIAPVKEPVARFHASFAAPDTSGWAAGVLLGYEAPDRFEALVVSDTGMFRRFDVDGSAFWNPVGAAPAAVAGRYEFDLVHTAGRVSVTVNGEVSAFDTALPPTSGLALNAGAVRFEEIRWE